MPRRKLIPKFKYTVRKPDKNGVPVLYVRYPVAGLKSPVWRKVEIESQAEVDRIIAELQNERAKVLHEAAVPEKCDKFFDYYLALVKNTVEERTWQSYEQSVRLYLKPAVGLFNLSEVRPIQLTMLHNQMLADGLSTRTVRAAHTVASMIFKAAVNLEIIPSNVVTRVRPPKMRKSEKVKVLSSDEVESFLGASRNTPQGIIFDFALETGMRPQEYLALRWSDVNLKRGKAEVTRALVIRPEGRRLLF